MAYFKAARQIKWYSTKAVTPVDSSSSVSTIEENDVSNDASNGWLYGYALDGHGGGRKLKPWDEDVIKTLQSQQRSDGEAPEELVGYWIHIDFVRAKNVAWLWNVVQASGVPEKTNEDEDMGTLWLSRLAAEQIVSLPRCEISAETDALFLSFRCALAPRSGVDVVELRFCLTRHLLLTARVQEHPDGTDIIPCSAEVDQQLREGRGGKTCGEVTAAIVAAATSRSTAAAQDAFERVLQLRGRFQRQALNLKGARPVPRKKLAFLSQHLSLVRYDSTKLLRYLTLQRDTLSALLAASNKRKQKIFSRADSQRFRQAVERQEAQIETLNNVGDSAEVLHGELMTHVNWGTADGTYRLMVFGGFASVLIIVNICASLFEFSERRGFLRRAGTVQPRKRQKESASTQTDE